jgi:hypothetical protein
MVGSCQLIERVNQVPWQRDPLAQPLLINVGFDLTRIKDLATRFNRRQAVPPVHQLAYAALKRFQGNEPANVNRTDKPAESSLLRKIAVHFWNVWTIRRVAQHGAKNVDHQTQSGPFVLT